MGMLSNGYTLLLYRDFIALRMFAFVSKVNENEFHKVSYFSLIFIEVSLVLKYSGY